MNSQKNIKSQITVQSAVPPHSSNSCTNNWIHFADRNFMNHSISLVVKHKKIQKAISEIKLSDNVFRRFDPMWKNKDKIMANQYADKMSTLIFDNKCLLFCSYMNLHLSPFYTSCWELKDMFKDTWTHTELLYAIRCAICNRSELSVSKVWCQVYQVRVCYSFFLVQVKVCIYSQAIYKIIHWIA